jgi:hypothetical protein
VTRLFLNLAPLRIDALWDEDHRTTDVVLGHRDEIDCQALSDHLEEADELDEFLGCSVENDDDSEPAGPSASARPASNRSRSTPACSVALTASAKPAN